MRPIRYGSSMSGKKKSVVLSRYTWDGSWRATGAPSVAAGASTRTMERPSRRPAPPARRDRPAAATRAPVRPNPPDRQRHVVAPAAWRPSNGAARAAAPCSRSLSARCTSSGGSAALDDDSVDPLAGRRQCAPTRARATPAPGAARSRRPAGAAHRPPSKAPKARWCLHHRAPLEAETRRAEPHRPPGRTRTRDRVTWARVRHRECLERVVLHAGSDAKREAVGATAEGPRFKLEIVTHQQKSRPGRATRRTPLSATQRAGAGASGCVLAHTHTHTHRVMIASPRRLRTEPHLRDPRTVGKRSRPPPVLRTVSRLAADFGGFSRSLSGVGAAAVVCRALVRIGTVQKAPSRLHR
eukprot:ctg_1661.g310